MTFRDHFAGVAETYAAFRPRYPEALFEWLASVVPNRGTAWDCACGSGQVSAPLGAIFDDVVATDASIRQIATAPALDRISFAVAPAEAAPLIDRSVDLVTVGSALHWFSGEAFFAEVRRVLRPGGVLAAWTYGLPEIEDAAVGRAVGIFGGETLAEFWPPEVRHVVEGYASLEIPFGELAVPDFDLVVHWTLPQMLGFVRSWSAVACFLERFSEDPVDRLEDELNGLWVDAQVPRKVRWSLAIRAARV